MLSKGAINSPLWKLWSAACIRVRKKNLRKRYSRYSASPGIVWRKSFSEYVRERREKELLRQGRRDRLPARPRREATIRGDPGFRSQRQDPDLWRCVLAHLHDRRQHLAHRDRFHEEFH